MAERQSQYLSYLLRLWQIGSDDALTWRASLETPGTGERRGFASFQELFAFLEAHTVKQKKQNAYEKGDSDES